MYEGRTDVEKETASLGQAVEGGSLYDRSKAPIYCDCHSILAAGDPTEVDVWFFV